MSLDEGRDLLCLRRGRVAGALKGTGETSGRGVGSADVGKTVLLWVAVVGTSGVNACVELVAEGCGLTTGTSDGWRWRLDGRLCGRTVAIF